MRCGGIGSDVCSGQHAVECARDAFASPGRACFSREQGVGRRVKEGFATEEQRTQRKTHRRSEQDMYGIGTACSSLRRVPAKLNKTACMLAFQLSRRGKTCFPKGFSHFVPSQFLLPLCLPLFVQKLKTSRKPRER